MGCTDIVYRPELFAPGGCTGPPLAHLPATRASSWPLALLPAGTQLHWQVTATTSVGSGPPSPCRSFSTDPLDCSAPPAIPVLVAPADGATGQSAEALVFDWNRPPVSIPTSSFSTPVAPATIGPSSTAWSAWPATARAALASRRFPDQLESAGQEQRRHLSQRLPQLLDHGLAALPQRGLHGHRNRLLG